MAPTLLLHTKKAEASPVTAVTNMSTRCKVLMVYSTRLMSEGLQNERVIDAGAVATMMPERAGNAIEILRPARPSGGPELELSPQSGMVPYSGGLQ